MNYHKLYRYLLANYHKEAKFTVMMLYSLPGHFISTTSTAALQLTTPSQQLKAVNTSGSSIIASSNTGTKKAKKDHPNNDRRNTTTASMYC